VVGEDTVAVAGAATWAAASVVAAAIWAAASVAAISLSLPTAHIHVTTRTVFMTRPIALPFQIRDNARRAPSPQMS
jgi:hypothetical protein